MRSVCNCLHFQQPGARTERGDREDHHGHADRDEQEHARGTEASQEERDEERRQDAAQPAPRVNEADPTGTDARGYNSAW